MHCSNEEELHSHNLVKMPSLETFRDHLESKGKMLVPQCVECGGNQNMKPHCMFFDESYNERYYRMDTVKKFLENADCALIIGTSLETMGA